jgi:hypothetical protein
MCDGVVSAQQSRDAEALGDDLRAYLCTEGTCVSEQAKKCNSCGAAPLGDDGACAKCGWNGSRGERRCLRCREIVTGSPDLERLKIPGGAAMVMMIGAGVLGGFLGGLAFGFAAGALGSVLMAQSFRYRCTGCGTVAPERILIEGERGEIRDRRNTLLIRGGLMAAASLVAGVLWIQAVLATVQTPPATNTAVLGPERPGTGPDIAALEKARDSVALVAILVREPLHRDRAAEALARLGDNAVPALLPVLTRGDEHAKRKALSVLERIAPRTERAIDALVAFVRTETNPYVRGDAIDVLGAAGSAARKAAVPVLEPLLADYAMAGTAESALRRIAPDTDWAAKRKALRKK